MSISRIRALREQRANVWEQMRALADQAQGRAFTGEEQSSWDAAERELDRLTQEIEREERLADSQRVIARRMSPGRVTRDAVEDPDDVLDDDDDVEDQDQEGSETEGSETEGIETEGSNPQQRAYRRAFRAYLRGGASVLSAPQRRALEATSPDLGGYLVAPMQFVRRLIQALDDTVAIRSLATTFPIAQSESLGVPSLDSDLDDAEWTTELSTGNEGTMEFGRRELHPHPVAKRVKASNKLLRQSVIDPEALVRNRLAYRFAVTEEKAFLVGDGVNKPLGVFVQSSDGIDASRNITVGSAGGDNPVTADGLIDCKYSLKAAYWRNARWFFHRDFLARVRKLKDANGQYLWAPGITNGDPDRILDLPYTVSEFAPNAFTGGSFVAVLGDFSFYWIADALNMQVQRLSELYAESNQTGFIGRLEVDGMPVLAEAFVRATVGA